VALALIALNVVFAVAVVLVVVRYRRAREAAAPVDEAGSVGLRIRPRPPDEDLAERCVSRALGQAEFVPSGGGAWTDRAGSQVRTAGPVLGDWTTLVEVPAERADDVLAGIVGVLVDEGFEVSGRRDRRVVLRRGHDRVDLTADRC
jgi:hypothetical protein